MASLNKEKRVLKSLKKRIRPTGSREGGWATKSKKLAEGPATKASFANKRDPITRD